jgi:predicted ATPase
LKTHLAQALDGTRQIVFIAGELGIGKTALVQTFLDTVRSDVWVAAGQCVEQYGRGEPYLPIVEGLERLIRDPRYPEAMRVVEDRAPAWLPWSSHSRQPRRATRDAEPNPAQMAGELTEAIEALAAVKPLVVLLEDLHWSDHATVELIARLGRRPDRARLLMIGTYRLAELVDAGSPLLRVCRELRAHFQADEIELPLLTQDAIAQFIARDKTWQDVNATAARLKQWSGNPLFLVHLLEHLERAGCLLERDGEWALDLPPDGPTFVPSMLRTLVEDQVDRLGPDHRRLLEIASVAGDPFQAAVVAHAVPQDVTVVERWFDDLCRRTHLVRRREAALLPDGTSSASYGFVHELYRHVVYERVPSATMSALHREIGTRLEVGYGDRGQEIALELATHFDRGHDPQRAVRYYARAAENALTRNADREAAIALSRAAELVGHLTPGDERHQIVLDLRAQFDAVFERLSHHKSWTTMRAGGDIPTLARAAGDSRDLLESLLRLSSFHALAGDLQAATEIGERAVAIGHVQRDGLFEATVQQAFVRALAGEFMASRSLALDARAVADRDRVPRSHEERMRCAFVLAWNTWSLGRYEESRTALDEILEAVDDARRSAAATWAAPILESLGEADQSAALIASAGHAGTPLHGLDAPWSTDAVHGWLLLHRRLVSGGLEILQKDAKALRRLGMHSRLVHTLTWLAGGFLINAQIDEARATAEEGLNVTRRTGVRCCDPELYRLRGEALMATKATKTSELEGCPTAGDRDAAEASFWAGISVARRQGARTLELRATLSLARLLRQSGRQDEVGRTLAPVCEMFADGIITPDLVEARNLLRHSVA